MKKFILSVVSLCFLFTSFGVTLSYADNTGMLPDLWDKEFFDQNKDPRFGQGVDLPKSSATGGLEQFQDLALNNIVQIVRYLVISISILYIFVNLLILILGSSDESKIEERRAIGGYIVLGLMLISMSSEIAKIFLPITNQGEFGDIVQAKHVFQLIINYISLIAGGIAVFFMLLSATKIITAEGDETVITEEKKDFQYGFVGLVVITLSDVMINKVFYPENIQAPGSAETLTFAQEVFGLLRYLLEYMAIIAIVFMVLAGAYYIIALTDEEDIGTAKTILKNLVIGFILIVIAYTLVSAVSPNLGGQIIAQ